MLNALLRTERAIVTPVAGTTRVTVEEVANLRGIPLHLIDTAGITPTDDPIEQIGVQRSRIAAEGADVIMLVFDGSEVLSEQDRIVCAEVQAMGFGVQHLANTAYNRTRPVVVVVNKADYPHVLDIDELQRLWPTSTFVHTSTRTGIGLPALEDAIAELVLAGKTISSDSVLITNARHQEALQRAADHMQASQNSLEQALPLDFVSIDLRAAYEALGEVTGEAASDDLLDTIFREFCIGK
ncbi:MAG: hypothetical protein NVS9B9_14460 [Ktedonobacteraceae bacterium]